mgnify:CR=1 FL=1
MRPGIEPRVRWLEQLLDEHANVAAMDPAKEHALHRAAGRPAGGVPAAVAARIAGLGTTIAGIAGHGAEAEERLGLALAALSHNLADAREALTGAGLDPGEVVDVVERQQADELLGVGVVQVHVGRPDLLAEGLGVATEQVQRAGARTRSRPARAMACAMGCSEASSTAAAAMGLLEGDTHYDAAICAPIVAAEQPGLAVLAENIGDNPGAVTRFVLVGRPGELPEPTGADKTTVVVPLPEDRPGALMEILDQFATRGVNLSRIESRPTGQYLGHYFFSIDADGHVADARVADALAGLHRISPATRFLGSYGRADGHRTLVEPHTSDQAFRAAPAWVKDILSGASVVPEYTSGASPTA